MLTAVSSAAVSSQPKKPASTPARLLVTHRGPLSEPQGRARWTSFRVAPAVLGHACPVTVCEGSVGKAHLILRAGPGGTVGSRGASLEQGGGGVRLLSSGGGRCLLPGEKGQHERAQKKESTSPCDLPLCRESWPPPVTRPLRRAPKGHSGSLSVPLTRNRLQ